MRRGTPRRTNNSRDAHRFTVAVWLVAQRCTPTRNNQTTIENGIQSTLSQEEVDPKDKEPIPTGFTLYNINYRTSPVYVFTMTRAIYNMFTMTRIA